jgi:hypothetical protein
MFDDIIATLKRDDVYLSVESYTEYDGTVYYALVMLRECKTYQKRSPGIGFQEAQVRTYAGPERLDVAYLP